jgi:hypothetical protein
VNPKGRKDSGGILMKKGKRIRPKKHRKHKTQNCDERIKPKIELKVYDPKQCQKNKNPNCTVWYII